MVFQRSRGPSCWHVDGFQWRNDDVHKRGFYLSLLALNSAQLLRNLIRNHPGSSGRTALIYAAWMLRDARQVWGDAGGAASGPRPGGAGEEVRYEGRISGGYSVRHFIWHKSVLIMTYETFIMRVVWKQWTYLSLRTDQKWHHWFAQRGGWSQNEPGQSCCRPKWL